MRFSLARVEKRWDRTTGADLVFRDRRGRVLSGGGIAFQAVKLEHFGLETYGYRFAYKGREIAFTGDTGECPQLYRLVDGAGLVVLEFTHPDDAEDAGHLNAAAVSRLTGRLREQGATVLATHLSGEPQSIEGLIICQDGEVYLV
jgi:ribonuclease BN (tRNA processing enzyme)